MSASRTDDSTLSAYYRHTVTNSGDVTVWGHNSTSTVDWTTSANLTVNSPCSTSSEFFNSNFSDSLTTNSTWSQTNNGPILGYNDATYTLAINYSGGLSNDYGGSYAYSGGQNWTWSDPNLSTYNARALSEFRITPAGPPEVGPVTFRSAPNVAFAMPPALVEDPEATAAAEQQSWEEWLIDQGIGFIPIVGSARDAYQAYMSGNNLILVSSLAMLGVDVLTLGGGTAAKVMVKSSLKAGKKAMSIGGKALKSKVDDGLKIVKNKLDNVAGGAKQISGEVTEVCQKYPGCFAAGTPIQTPLGSKPIDEFVPGDWVLAQDESDPEAAPTIRQVEEVFENQAQVMVLGLGGRSIETTPEHPFWVRDKGWTAAGEIEPGDELRSHDGQWITLDSRQLTDSIVTVYNMRVAEDHTYFVGSALWGFSVWAHNMCAVEELSGKPRLTKQQIKDYLNSLGTKNPRQVAQDIEGLGLRMKSDPNMQYMQFTDNFGRVRAKIHPPDRVTQYPHLHIYTKKGASISINLQKVSYKSRDAHIPIGGLQ